MINIIFYNASEIREKKGRKNTINQYLLRFDQCLLENRYFIEILLKDEITEIREIIAEISLNEYNRTNKEN